MADRDRDDGSPLRPRQGIVGLGDRTKQCERLEVDADDLQTRLLAGKDVAIDELAVGDDEENAADGLPFGVDRLGEHLVVEHCVLDRDRQHLLRTESNRVRKLLRIVDADDVEGPDADPVVGDAESDPTLREAVALEEVPQRDGERLGVAKLSADDDAVVERLAHRLDELGRAAVVNTCRSDLRPADLEPDDLLRALAGKRALGERGLRARQAEHLRLRLLRRRRLRLSRLGSVPFLGLALEREVALVERHLRAGLGVAGLRDRRLSRL